MHYFGVLGMVRRFAISAFAFIMILTLLAPVTQAGDTESSIQGIYDVRAYGNIVLLLLNRFALRFVDGFWVAEGVNMVDLTQQILNIAGGYTVEGVRVVVSNGKACAVGYNRSCAEVERLGDDFAYVVSALVRAGLRNGSLELYRHNDNTLRILVGMGVAESLGIDRIVNALSAMNRRVVVQEVVALGRIPSCFEALELCSTATSTPCFTSFTETAYGLQITLGYNCVKKLAEERNTSIDGALGTILEVLKPLVDKYFDQRPLVVLVPEVGGVLLIGGPAPITPTTIRAEEPQTSKAVSSMTTATTHAWTSTSTPTNTQNPETTGFGMNLTLVVATSSTVAAALILAITYRRTLGRR